MSCHLLRHGFAQANEFEEVRLHVEQGVEIGRPSHIESRMTVRNGSVERVAVQGEAILVLEGKMRMVVQPE